MPKRVLLLGSSGMLGSMVLDFFSDKKGIELSATSRDKNFLLGASKKYTTVSFKRFEIGHKFQAVGGGFDFIINTTGIIKPYIKEDDPGSKERAILINSLFPYVLNSEIKKSTRVIKVATDCVFSGKRGSYNERDPHDPLDVYGKTQSLGEVQTENFFNIRCSIIGPERRNKFSLLEWFLSQKDKSFVKGYLNHRWNGITTLHFAKLCLFLIKSDYKPPSPIHFIPSDVVSKYELLNIFAKKFSKNVDIDPYKTPVSIDRSLVTLYDKKVKKIWKSMGYASPPTIEMMVDELFRYISERNFYKL